MCEQTKLEAILGEVKAERTYQNEKFGQEFDNKNTPNDWVAYIAAYLGKAVSLNWDAKQFRTALIKVATLCVAAIENIDNGTFAKRHYDA
jgi:hypothetical protein